MGVTDRIEARVGAKGESTLDEFVLDPRPRPTASRSTAPLFGGRRTLSGRRMKQDLQALEQKRKDVADRRHIRITKRRPFMADHLERLAFIEATSVKTNMAKPPGGPHAGSALSTTRRSGAGARKHSSGPCAMNDRTRHG